jgi:hypothetical protein
VTVFALILAGLLCLWMSLTYVALLGVVPYMQRVLATAYALEVALLGLVGMLVGVFLGSFPVALVFGAVAVCAGLPVVRIWRAPDVLGDATRWSSPPAAGAPVGPHRLRRSWGLRMPGVPRARLQKDVAFATPPGRARPLLCDLWQPPLDVPPSGLAFIYFHGSAWVLLDKDFGTRRLFRRLAAQGHVVMDVAYRLYPETDIEGMVGDVRRSVPRTLRPVDRVTLDDQSPPSTASRWRGPTRRGSGCAANCRTEGAAPTPLEGALVWTPHHFAPVGAP